MKKPVASLIGLLIVAGCATPVGMGVDVETATHRGRGVIVGPHTVLTVCHVVAGSDDVEVEGMAARVVSRHLRSTETGDDGVAVLELVNGTFPADRIGSVAEKVGPGVVYLPSRGETPWPWGLQPGDSGSPILDAHGKITGLVRAVYGRAEPLDQSAVGTTTGVGAARVHD